MIDFFDYLSAIVPFMPMTEIVGGGIILIALGFILSLTRSNDI